MPIEFHPASRSLADTAADFKARFKLSLAKEKKAELLTGDPEFKAMSRDLRMEWI